MDISPVALTTGQSGCSKSKNDLIQQAHEARQARELNRKREKAASQVQAFLHSAHVRIKLREEAILNFERLVAGEQPTPNNSILVILRKLIFVCHPDKDRTILDSMLHYILSTSSSHNAVSDNTAPTKHSDQISNKGSPQSLIDEAILESLKGIPDEDSVTKDEQNQNDATQSKPTTVNLIQVILDDVASSEKKAAIWADAMTRIIKMCMTYLQDTNSTRLDSQHINSYLTLVSLYTTSQFLAEAIPPDTGKDYREVASKLSQKITSATLLKSSTFFECLTRLIFEKITRFRNDLKSSILKNYLAILMRMSRQDMDPNALEFVAKRQAIDTIMKALSVPGFIIHLEKYSPEMLSDMINLGAPRRCVRLLLLEQEFQTLNSTSAVCVLANIVHLVSKKLDYLSNDCSEFVQLVTRLLVTSQKNMNSCTDTKVTETRDVSFNPILGWLCREQVINIDKDMLRSQLSHLWSLRFLKMFFNDLIEYNKKQSTRASLGRSSSNAKHLTKNAISIDSSFIDHEISPISCARASIGSPIHFGALRKAVERAASSVTKTINSSYIKTSGSSSSSGSAKLLSPEVNRIANICQMLHSALKSLTTIKQDILTGLCLHDFILLNLWTFIKSLGPHNGLKAFLEHLTIHNKTSSSEFHIMTIFCECASHIVSILDDSELYEKQKPFQIEDLVSISAFLNQYVFRIICNNLIPSSALESDPVFQSCYKLLIDLYKRDCRRRFAPQDHWLVKDIKMSVFVKDLDAGKPTAKAIMKLMPHVIPHKDRVVIFRKLVAKDKERYTPRTSTLITIHRSQIVEDGYQQLIRLPSHALKGLVRVWFINDHGLDEAGLDQDGVFKEFLEDTIKRVFDPALNLFCCTSEQRLYPSPTSRLHEDHLTLFNFVGRMIGKAVYEGIVVDVPFATFFLSRVLGQPQSPLYSPIDELPSLDPELYKSLTYIKHYEGDVADLELTFSIDQDFMGKIETHELEIGGRSIPVTRESRVRYIHSVANFRVKTQIEKQTEAFIQGFKSIINLEWLSMFSASEFQRLISGDNLPIDLADLRRNTKYFGGFYNNHRVVCWLWDILEKDFNAEEHRLFLKFVTSCSKPPLLGFANLEPPFSIRCVDVSDEQDQGDTVSSVLRGFFAIRRSDPVDRLPTSSTCFNLLKLPNYQRRSTLKDKLRYAIRSNSGFELS